MGTITLDDRDEAILERLAEGKAAVEALARDVDCSPDHVRNRLPELADNGLVHHVDGGYALTDNGARAIAASPAGTRDDRIDTPADVEQRIASFDLRADRVSALGAAFSFLRYWGDATAGEIVDAGYSERPAGAGSADAWWTEVIRDRLAALPRVDPPGADDRYWRYDGTPVLEKHTADGRIAPAGEPSAPGSARMAIEQLGLSDTERTAVRAAFDHLVRGGEVSAAALESAVYPDHAAGYASADDWWADLVEPAFASIPDAEPVDDDGDRWRHRHVATGAMSSDPGADVPEEVLAPADGPPPRADHADESATQSDDGDDG